MELGKFLGEYFLGRDINPHYREKKSFWEGNAPEKVSRKALENDVVARRFDWMEFALPYIGSVAFIIAPGTTTPHLLGLAACELVRFSYFKTRKGRMDEDNKKMDFYVQDHPPRNPLVQFPTELDPGA